LTFGVARDKQDVETLAQIIALSNSARCRAKFLPNAGSMFPAQGWFALEVASGSNNLRSSLQTKELPRNGMKVPERPSSVNLD
jgi:hypothetical protein